MGRVKKQEAGFFDNILSCSCFEGRNQKKVKEPKQLDNQERVYTTKEGMAPLPMINRSEKSIEEMRQGNSNASFATTTEGADEKTQRALDREDKAQKKKERHDRRMKEQAEQDMLNGPFSDQIKKESKDEAKKNKTPGWEHDGPSLQSLGQQEILDGPEDKQGMSPSRIRGNESEPSTNQVSGKKKKKGKK